MVKTVGDICMLLISDEVLVLRKEGHDWVCQDGMGRLIIPSLFCGTSAGQCDGECAYAVDRSNNIHIFNIWERSWKMISG